MDLNVYVTDENLAKDGVWVELQPGCKVRVAMDGNPHYIRRLKTLCRPYQRSIEKKTIDGEVMADLILQAVSECILVDWEGIEENGKKLKYSQKECYRILKDPKYKQFRDMISDIAQDMRNYKEDAEELGEKN